VKEDGYDRYNHLLACAMRSDQQKIKRVLVPVAVLKKPDK